MRHDYSLAHLTVLSLTPPQVVDVAARAGYRYVGLRLTRVTPAEPLYDLAHDRALMKETKSRLDDTGVEVLDIELFRMDPSLDAESFIPVLEAAAELGATQIIAQLPDPDRKRATERFARLCDLAKPLGIFVSLEFPHWTETGNLATAAKVVRAVKRSNAGILVDMLHMGRSDSSLERSRLTAARVVPLRPCLRCGQGGAPDAGRHHPHGARRAAVSGGGRYRRPWHPGMHAAGHSLCAGDSAGCAHQGGRPGGSRAAGASRVAEPFGRRREKLGQAQRGAPPTKCRMRTHSVLRCRTSRVAPNWRIC